MKKIISLLALLLGISLNLFAQESVEQTVEMADQFRADGKIYVVVAVVLVILIGMFVYLSASTAKLVRWKRN